MRYFARPNRVEFWLTFAIHEQRIEAIDTVRCYTAGNYYLAEIDIVLPKTMSVLESHDIAQALQDFIEELPAIERCFVHIDYETEHVPEHSPESRQQFRSALQAPVSPPILAEHAPVSRQ